MSEQPNRWLRARRVSGDAYDATYEDRAAEGEDVHGEANFVQHFSPTSVLDAGCGTGRVGRELARRGIDVVGVDIDPEMLATARVRIEQARLEERIRLVEGDAQHLPFDDASFDGLTFTYLLRYVEDVGATLGELARTVRASSRSVAPGSST